MKVFGPLNRLLSHICENKPDFFNIRWIINIQVRSMKKSVFLTFKRFHLSSVIFYHVFELKNMILHEYEYWQLSWVLTIIMAQPWVFGWARFEFCLFPEGVGAPPSNALTDRIWFKIDADTFSFGFFQVRKFRRDPAAIFVSISRQICISPLFPCSASLKHLLICFGSKPIARTRS